MSRDASEITSELARNAEAVCRHYLPAGRREGSYWIVGDITNNPGRSLYVRLVGPAQGKGAAGKYTDGSTGEHGDLLDIIRARTGIARFPDILAEATRFLGFPAPVLVQEGGKFPERGKGDRGNHCETAGKLFRASVPVAGSLAEVYLASRGIRQKIDPAVLRFHAKCWHRDQGSDRAVPRPAMIAAVTDIEGTLQGVHRTWLAPDGKSKADVKLQRRAMGNLLGNAVKFGQATDVVVVGEGIETMLSIRQALPQLPVWSSLSAGHLGAVLFPKTVTHVYVAEEPDEAGRRATERLRDRAQTEGWSLGVLKSRLGDFNDDLMAFGIEVLAADLTAQLRRDTKP